MKDDFIGRKFGSDSQITVICESERITKPKLYKVYCAACANDYEMYGDGIFEITKHNLLNGIIPCGCSKYFRKTTKQYELLIKRKCIKIDYEILGLPNKIYHNSNIVLKCKKHDFIINTTTKNFLNGRNGCKPCVVDITINRSIKNDMSIINSFFETGKYKVGTIFGRIDNNKYKWGYRCPVCSNDEYVKHGLCSGVFVSGGSDYIKGKLSCRCSKTFRWSKAQREYQINKILSIKNMSHLRYIDIDDKTDKIEMRCKLHGKYKVSVKNFISKYTDCASCKNGSFKQNEPASIYVILAESIYDIFCGFGVSNVITTRLKTHERNLFEHGYKIIDVKIYDKINGDCALNIENSIKKNFYITNKNIEGFITEATYSYNFHDVCNFVESKIELLTEEQVAVLEARLNTGGVKQK